MTASNWEHVSDVPALGRRLPRVGRGGSVRMNAEELTLALPPVGYGDWNDVLQALHREPAG